jgi:hypothetical protein
MSTEPVADTARAALVRHVVDLIHRTTMHHAMWYAEVERQFGFERASEALSRVLDVTVPLQLRRIGRTLGFDLTDELPAPLLALDEETLIELRKQVSLNWLANDGIWFQAIEQQYGMFDAKRCNDCCWTKFSPFEARSIKRLLGLGERPGLDGLRQALGHRLYANINEQSFHDESEHSFVFQMNDCRVQSARQRKGLPDYPCKSAGLVEYRSFAETIDDRIATECIGCPPDDHPNEWFCAWRFSLRTG